MCIYSNYRSVLFLFTISLLISSCHVFRAIRWLEPSLSDANKFAYIPLMPSSKTFHYLNDTSYLSNERKLFFTKLLKGTNTNAFLIIKNNKMVFHYFPIKSDSSKAFLGFSLSKSFVGALIGIAIDEGYIESTNESVVKYIPEIAARDAGFNSITIQQLLDMRSDIDYDESIVGLNSPVTQLYYGKNINKRLRRLKTLSGAHQFSYRNINTQILSVVIERATHQKFIDYFYKKLWLPLGCQHNGRWLIDDEMHKVPKAYCGLVASAYDFAKLGSLYLNKGYFNGQQILSRNWVEKSTNFDSLFLYNYKNQWWANNDYMKFDSLSTINAYKVQTGSSKQIIRSSNKYYLEVKGHSFHADGMYEQSIDVFPDKNLVMVRLGNVPSKGAYSLENIVKVLSENF